MLKFALPGVESLDLDDLSNGISVSDWDPGYPEIRQVIENAVDRDGTSDQTTWIGARVCSLKGELVLRPGQSRDQVLSRLRRFLAPGERPILIWRDETDPGCPERWAVIRADQHSAPLVIPGSAEVAAVWRCPDGRWYGTALHSQLISLGGTDAGGVTFDLGFDLRFPVVTGGSGLAYITVGGDIDTPPLIRFYSECLNPRLQWVDTGEQIGWLGWVHSPDYVELDVGARTVRLNSDPNADRYYAFDFEHSTWPHLDAGTQRLRFSADEVIGNATCELIWRDASL